MKKLCVYFENYLTGNPSEQEIDTEVELLIDGLRDFYPTLMIHVDSRFETAHLHTYYSIKEEAITKTAAIFSKAPATVGFEAAKKFFKEKSVAPKLLFRILSRKEKKNETVTDAETNAPI